MTNDTDRITQTQVAGSTLGGKRLNSAQRPARGRVRLLGAGALSLMSVLFIGLAMAQEPYGPIADGRQLQPTQQQLETRRDPGWDRWNRQSQSDVDRLYGDIMRAATPPRSQ
jgi:hypothetical protein